jgi:NADH pyrophosphatase NudC (nudix superfamily)
MQEFIPHLHKCEIKLCFPSSWEDKCVLKGRLTESEDECEQCKHFITVNFDPNQPTIITGIIRGDGLIVAEQNSVYKNP